MDTRCYLITHEPGKKLYGNCRPSPPEKLLLADIPPNRVCLMKKLKLKPLPSLVRWIFWVLLVQFILINVSAALYAYKLTHFYTDPSVRQPVRNRNILDKTWRLFPVPVNPSRSSRISRFFPTIPWRLPRKKGSGSMPGMPGLILWQKER